MNNIKVYVNVIAQFNSEGVLIPLSHHTWLIFAFFWEDGEKFDIDRVTDIRQAAAMKAGGQGDRYTIWVRGRQSYLFFERNHSLTGNNLGRWFVERRTA